MLGAYAEDIRFQKGSKGDEVKEVQQRLIDLGFLDGKADGAFGSQTEKAVIAFQKVAELEQTGIVDNQTYSLLISDDAPMAPYSLQISCTLKKNQSKMRLKYLQHG